MAETKEELQAQVKQLTQDLATANQDLAAADKEKTQLATRVDGLSESLVNANKEVGDLQQQLTDERQRSGDAAGELNEAQTLIEDLQKRLERAELRQSQSDAVVVSDGEYDYKVLAPKFKFEHVTYEATELKDNEALVKRLVAAGVGFLHKIEAGE